MYKGVNDERGITLVELLAVLAIGSIILLFISSTHIFVQNQYNSQSAESRQLVDEIQAVKVITKKVRMTAGEIVVNSENNSIEFPDGDKFTYDFDTKTLYRNNVPFTNGLEIFHVDKVFISHEGETLYEAIKLIVNNHETEIVLRGSE